MQAVVLDETVLPPHYKALLDELILPDEFKRLTEG